MFIVGCD